MSLVPATEVKRQTSRSFEGTSDSLDPETASYDDFDDDLRWSTDLQNPRNWSKSKKWISVAVVRPFQHHQPLSAVWTDKTRCLQVSFYTLFPPLASSMMAPALPEVATKYHITNPTVLALTLSVFLTSFAIGVCLLLHKIPFVNLSPFQPLIFAPLSEMYGRTWVIITVPTF